MDEPVPTARKLLNGEYSHAWAAPLVRTLRDRSFDLALDWVVHCVRDLPPRTGSIHADQLLIELAEIERWRAQPPLSKLFREKTEALWYVPSRDYAQTALSTLCWDMACVICPDLEVGVNWLWPVLSLLCGLESPRPDLVEWCFADFESFVQEVDGRTA